MGDRINEDDSKQPLDEGSRGLLDALCMCRQFTTPLTHWKSTKLNATECSSIRFEDRWNLLRKIPDLPYNENGEITLPGGLHALVYESYDNTPATLAFAFRHQEGTTLWDNDQWEAMGLYGRNAIQHELFGTSTTKTLASFVTSVISTLLQRAIYGVRRYVLGHDYFSQSQRMVRHIVHHYKKKTDVDDIIFVGYSLGGTIAQLNALSTPHYGATVSAVTFASPGVMDILKDLYGVKEHRYHQADHLNLFANHDVVPELDCQVGLQCTFDASNSSYTAEELHEELVYGKEAFRVLLQEEEQQTNPFQCVQAEIWNQEHAVCASLQKGGNETRAWGVLALSTITVILVTAIFIKRRRQ